MLLIKGFQALVLGREAATAGHVHDQEGFALVLGKGDLLPIEGLGLELVDGHGLPPGKVLGIYPPGVMKSNPHGLSGGAGPAFVF
jgi:hypothetical protein